MKRDSPLSQPSPLKGRGLNGSELAVLQAFESPVDPRQQALDVLLLDRATAPDAQAWRRVAVAVEVVGDVHFLERRGDLLRHRGLFLGGETLVPVTLEDHAHA